MCMHQYSDDGCDNFLGSTWELYRSSSNDRKRLSFFHKAMWHENTWGTKFELHSGTVLGHEYAYI